jgi:carbamoyltransferase
MIVLGINAYHGDVAAALLVDGQLVAAIEEERFRRVKHWAGFPTEAIRACLAAAGITASDVDRIAVSRDPRANLWRKALFAARRRPSASLLRDRAANASRIQQLPDRFAREFGLDRAAVARRLVRVEHHPAHLASAFFASPFESAAVCAIDGFGDFVSTSRAMGEGTRLRDLGRVHFPHSVGLLYLAITQYLGFPRYGDEYKVMGLAPYGAPDFVNEIRRLVRLERGGGFALDLTYFLHHRGNVPMTWDDGEPTLGPVFSDALEGLLGPARQPDQPLTARHEAIAASLQVVFEEVAVHVLTDLHRRTRASALCLAGGCAMNSVMNGKIRARTPFTRVYVQPAAGDNGTALGAALHVWHQIERRPRGFVMSHGYWGPAFDAPQIRTAIDARAADVADHAATVRCFNTDEELCAWAAELLESGRILGWFQGRMEWGARALGNRSILADPRRADMREIINTKIKFRERFRPFAPSILEEAVGDYFVDAVPDPFMIQVYPVRPDKRSEIPAVTHVDGSGRLQTVSRDGNPLYWKLIDAFRRRTGVPVVLNTSFNENEPIVLKPAEALDCFLRTRMDAIALGRTAIEKPRA